MKIQSGMKVSKPVYLIAIFGLPLVGTVLAVVALLLIDPKLLRQENPPVGFVVPVLVIWLVSAVFYFRLLYLAWAAIQDGPARTTPGKAVGFCFIPFYNLYWAFQAFHGFAVDFNQFATQRGLSVRMPEGIFLAYSILLIASSLPILSIFAILPMLVLFVMVIIHLCDAVNAVGDESPVML